MNNYPVSSTYEPLVTIITPTLNGGKYIARAIKSVLSQTYRNFELIIVDDGSKDNTKDVVEFFKKNDNRIKYIWYETNKGAAYARNCGIRDALGEYIAFLDSDDEWLPDKLKLQIEKFKASEVKNLGVVYGTTINDLEEKTRVVKTAKFSGDVTEYILKHVLCPSAASNFMFKKEVFEKCGYFDENDVFIKGTRDDHEMWIRIAQYFNFDIVLEPVVIYYWHKENATSNVKLFDKIKAYEYLVSKHFAVYEKLPVLLSRQLRVIGVQYCLNDNMKIGRMYLLRSLRCKAVNIKSFVLYLLSLLGKKYFKILYEHFSSR